VATVSKLFMDAGCRPRVGAADDNAVGSGGHSWVVTFQWSGLGPWISYCG
jgi:hypothetical protein